MNLSTSVKRLVNKSLLNPIGVKVESLTAERAKGEKLRRLVEQGHFQRPAFPLPPSFEVADPAPILESISRLEGHLARLERAESNDVGYSFDNDYYSTPDAEVLYAILATTNPALFLEVGSGNSTKIARQAIIDHCLRTRICSVDPRPRVEVDSWSDETVRTQVEQAEGSLFERLQPGDVLFIDSSHIISTGNDVNYLYLNVLQRLQPGVLIHIHDVFLPFDYPEDWMEWEWTEQYLVQVMLAHSDAFEVLWAGHYFQHTKDIASHFTRWKPTSRAQSLWLRKLG